MFCVLPLKSGIIAHFLAKFLGCLHRIQKRPCNYTRLPRDEMKKLILGIEVHPAASLPNSLLPLRMHRLPTALRC